MLSGFFGFLGQTAMATALQHEKAARLAGLEYIQIVFGFILDILLFKGTIGLPEILGSLLIAMSSLIVTLLKCTDKLK